MSKKYYWLKLKDDFFDSLRIKKLRKVAGGDTYTIIYLKMQLKAMKHEGIIMYSGIENTLAEEIALDIDEDPENVGLTLNYLQATGLCEVNGEDIYLPYAVENTGSETASAQRVREHRLKALHCNTDVTQAKQLCNVEKEKKLDIDKDKDIDVDRRYRPLPEIQLDDLQIIVDTWNTQNVTHNIQDIRPFTERYDNTRFCINNNLGKFLDTIRSLDDQAFFISSAKMGKTVKYDWFVKTQNYQKVLEGNYTNAYTKGESENGLKVDW